MKATRVRPTEGERFWSKVDKTPDCWLWTAGKDWDGYGIFARDGSRSCRAHRWSYEQAIGPIPEGLQIDHLCRVRNCVRPDHLEAVTSRTNTLRGETRAAKNAIKTHCPYGHLLNDARKCSVCTAVATRIYQGWDEQRAADTAIGTPPALRTACPQGHSYTVENTWRDKHGNRHCRACHRDRERDRYYRTRETSQ